MMPTEDNKTQENGQMSTPGTDETAVAASAASVGSGRSQRVRRAPKRLEDDIVYGVPGSKKPRWTAKDAETTPTAAKSPQRKPSNASSASSTAKKAAPKKTATPKTKAKPKAPSPPPAAQEETPDSDDEPPLQIQLSAVNGSHPPEPSDNATSDDPTPDDDHVKVNISEANIDQILNDDEVFSLDPIDAHDPVELVPLIDQMTSSDDAQETKADETPQPRDSQVVDDVEEEEDEEDSSSDPEYNEDDDPDKIWCICRRPHEGRFMIGCDCCGDWFHGECVNITKDQGAQMEKEGKDYICAACETGLAQGKTSDELKKECEERQTQDDERKQNKGIEKIRIKLSKDLHADKSKGKGVSPSKSKLDDDPEMLRNLIKQKKKELLLKSISDSKMGQPQSLAPVTDKRLQSCLMCNNIHTIQSPLATHRIVVELF